MPNAIGAFNDNMAARNSRLALHDDRAGALNDEVIADDGAALPSRRKERGFPQAGAALEDDAGRSSKDNVIADEDTPLPAR